MKHLKKIALILLLAISVEYSNGQVILSLLFGDKLNSDELSFGLHVDYGWNNLSNVHPSSSLTNLDLGLFLTYKLNEKWRLNTEMMAKYHRGASGMKPYPLNNPVLDAGYADGELIRNIGYLALPVTIQYMLSKAFYAEAGLYGAIKVSAKDKFTIDIDEGESSLNRNIKSSINTWDFGYLGGIGLLVGKSKLIAVGCRYSGGFSDVAKDMSGMQANNSLYIYANIPIGKAKAAKKAAAKKANANK